MPKLRYNCEAQGCFNKKKRPKIEVFDDCFPGRIAFGDVDAVVEMGGNFIFLEWKDANVPITTGQKIMHNKMIERGDAILVLNGDAETMVVVDGYIMFGEKKYPVRDLDAAKKALKWWVAIIDKQMVE